ncbi:probable WRKY transcription factor 70 [Tanacetum coccineum]
MLQRSEMIVSNKPSVDDMLIQILGMFSNTLSILSSCTFNEIPHILTDDITSPSNSDTEYTYESPQTVTPVKPKRGCYKRRKDSSWTSTKVTSDLIDDGYAWRKYGQKEILNKTHKRRSIGMPMIIPISVAKSGLGGRLIGV